MDSDALKAFTCVAECASFSSASQKLFITQPAVSKRISALEKQLNHKLFDRNGRETSLTEAGKALLPKAQLILREMREAERSIQELSGEIVGTLRAATSHHIGLHHLPPYLRNFAALHRDVNLQFEFLDSEQANEKVLQGDCELAIVTLAPKIEAPLQAKILWRDPLCYVVNHGHPLAKKAQISMKDLSEHPAILPDLNTYTGRIVKARFDAEGLNLKLNMATNYLETVKMMVSVGLGWSVLPKTLVDEQITEVNVLNSNLYRELGVITHKRRSLGNAARAFYDLLVQ